MVDAEAVRADLADEEPRRFERRRRRVDGGRLDVRLAEREPQLGQMGHLVDLSARRLEQDRRADAPVDVAQRPLRVGVERPGVRHRSRDVGVDGGVEPRLAELPEERRAELGRLERRRAERDQRLPPRLPELLARRPRNPARQHRQRAARLLELAERAPLPLEDRQGRGMERVARLEPPAQEVARLRAAGRRVDRRPLGRQPGAPFEAPVGVRPGRLPPRARVAEVLEQPPAHHLADLRLVVRHQILGDAADHLGDPVLPLPVPVGHLHLAARQTDDRGGPGGAGRRDRQVLDEGVQRLGHAAMPVDEVQHLVEQQQHRRVRGGEHRGDRLGAGRRRPRRGPERRDSRLAGKLPREVDPRHLPALGRVPCVTDEDAGPRGGRRRHVRRRQQIGHAGQVRRPRPGPRQMVERRERMRLAAAELRDQRQHRRRVRRPPGQPPQHHPGMLGQRPREAGAGEELRRVAVVVRRSPRHHLLERNGELVRAERPPLAHFRPGGDYLVPGVHQKVSVMPASPDASPNGRTAGIPSGRRIRKGPLGT